MKYVSNNMNDSQHITVKTFNTLFLFIVTLFALYFGKERSVFFDGADWLYEIIKNNNNYTPHYRFSVGINGILPWICSFFTKDVNLILDAFILNYALTPIFIFLVLRYYFKDEKFVTLFVLGQCLFHTRVFFHPNHDALTGYYYLLIFTAFIISKNPNTEKRYYIKASFLCFLVVLTHLTQYIFLYIIVFYVYYYENNHINVKRILKIATLLLIFKILFLSSGYEVALYKKAPNILVSLKQTFNSCLTRSFYKSLLTFNLSFFIVFIFISAILILNRKYTLFLFILFPFLFILYFMSFYFGKWPHTFAQEGYFKSAIIIPILVLINNSNYKKYIYLFYVILIISSITFFYTIFHHGNNYKKYYQNINYVASHLRSNTIYFSSNIFDNEENYILHRHSTLINMIENNRCYYYQAIQDTFNWQNNSYIQDTIAGGFCFKEKPQFSIPSDSVLYRINAQKNLIINNNF